MGGEREETERKSRHYHQKVGACGGCPSSRVCVQSSRMTCGEWVLGQHVEDRDRDRAMAGTGHGGLDQ